MPLDVVLIHGTFDPDAAWTKQGSRIATSLKGTLKVADRHCIPFCWTGDNTMEARQRARDDLRQVLHARLAADPESRFLMVAHSHGGNIAIGALGDEQLSTRCAGLVCIATPFLQFARRNLGKYALAPFVGLALAVALSIALVLGRAMWDWASCPPGVCTNSFSDVVSFLFVGVLLTILVMAVLTALPASLLSRLRGRVRVPETEAMPPAVPLGLIRVAGDEASAVLGAAQNLSILCTTLWRWVTSRWGRGIARSGRAARRPAFVLVGLTVLLALIGGSVAFALHPRRGLTALGWVLTNLPVLITLALVVAALASLLLGATFAPPALVVMPLIGLLVAFSWLAYGRDAALMALFVDVSAEATPPGEWSVCLLESVGAGTEPDDIDKYSHSRICHDADAVAWIARWAQQHVGHG